MISKEFQKLSYKTKSEKLSVRNRIRLWLLTHPRLNPYNFSFTRTYRIATNRIRMLPDFIIIGSSKSGTTSLYNYMIQHPSIGSASIKEVHFFEYITTTSIGWYRSHFPTYIYKNYVKLARKQDFITGVAPATYLFHPHVPKRVLDVIPHVKLIVILRNPVDRAFSAYNHMVREGLQTLSFEDAIKSELKRIEIGKKEPQFIVNNDDFENYPTYSYLRHGIYVEYLKNWMNTFPKKQFLILQTKELGENPTKTLDQTFEFLNLPNHKIKDLERLNVGKYSRMRESTRKFLIDYYKPYNEKLYKYLDINFEWDK